MSKTSMLLRSILPLLAVAFLALPQAASAAQVCPLPLPNTDCTLNVTMTPVNPDPTVLCPGGETVYQLSFSVQCEETICSFVSGPVLVCGAWGSNVVVSVCGVNYTLDPSHGWKWRDIYTDCSKVTLY
jgi:hypothetical protein